MTAPVIGLQDIGYVYPDGTRALTGLDVHIHAGERVALLGPNGAGKTTLAHHLNGILRPTEGHVEVGGMPVIEPNLVEVRRRVGLVFQDPDDQLFMPTVRDDVAFGPANLGVSGDELESRTREALAAVRLVDAEDKAPHHLSGGERRRAAIATVLAMRPDLLVLDEPTSNLDPAGVRELFEVLADLPVTQLVITHDLPFALELCPRAIVMDGGRVVADGRTVELMMDAELLRAHRLALPYGFDPSVALDR